VARSAARGIPAFVVLLGVALVAVACSGDPAGKPGAQGNNSPSAAAGSDVVAAASILSAARLADQESLGALEGIRFTTAGTQAAAAALAAGASGDALWAATYVYASSADDPAPLLLVVANPAASASVRTMAAAALLWLGKAEGFDPLIAGLGVADPMAGAEPAVTVWEFAASVLERSTSATIAPAANRDEATRAAVASAWSAWLTANHEHLRFDPASHLWISA
jgi:hypothetical protein